MTTAWRILATSMAIWITVGNSAWADRRVKTTFTLCCVASFCMYQSVCNGKSTAISWGTKLTYHSQTALAVQSLSVANVTVNQWLDVAIHTVLSAWCILSVITCGLRQQEDCIFCLFNTPPKPKCASSETYTAYSVISSCSASPTDCTVLISG